MNAVVAPRKKTQAAKKSVKPAAKKAAAPAPRNKEDGPTAMIARLEVGESYVVGQRFAIERTSHKDGSQWLERTTRNLSVATDRVKKNNPKTDYTVERGRALTASSANILHSVFVTRTR